MYKCHATSVEAREHISGVSSPSTFLGRVSLISGAALYIPGVLGCELLSDSPVAASHLTSGVQGLQMHSSTSGSLYGNQRLYLGGQACAASTNAH